MPLAQVVTTSLDKNCLTFSFVFLRAHKAFSDFQQSMAAKILDRERGNLVKRLNEANIKRLVDILFSQNVINQFEKETIMETHGRADKARVLVDITYAKGERASELMITQLKVVDLMLYNDIFLKTDSMDYMDGSPVFNMR
uniref:uncharacterized protein LOC124039369 n=1 Tax=Oncorhynchus gorbuscha TaxID=8017 RepID=UPI001EAE8E25|nr:uncharacterized protein LOC124039369 [Oncorhynchus gorbuscha]